MTPCHLREVFRANMYKSKQFTSVRFRDFVVLRVDEKSEKRPALNWDRLASMYGRCLLAPEHGSLDVLSTDSRSRSHSLL